MLCADSVPRSENAALQKGERGFDGIRVNVALHVNFEAMPNRFVATFFPQSLRCAAIGVKVVGEKHVHVLADVLVNELLKCSALYVLRVEEAEIAASLTDADYDFLV